MKILGKSINRCSMFTIATATLSGFLFGYYTAIISGALLFISADFHFNLSESSNFVSSILLGAILGSSLGGYLCDRLGRKKIFLLTCLLLSIGCFVLVLSSSYIFLIVSRIIQGMSIGIISVLVPLYLGEISSAALRGGIISVYQLMINLGILVAYFVNYKLTPSANWQLMFLVGLLPVFLQALCVYFIPESPLWLFKKKKSTLAIQSLEKLNIPPLSFDSSGEKSITISRKTVIFIVFVGVVLGAIQQFTGINIVVFYAPRIFNHVGFSSHLQAMIATMILGFANFIGCCFSVWLLDHVGRRRLLLIGVFGMMVSLVGLSIFSFFDFPVMHALTVLSLITYMIFFSVGPGPVTWVLLSEIYPHQVRDKAMTLSLLVNWISVYFVLWTFPFLLHSINIAGTFGIYAFLNFFSFLFIFKFIPETKQKSLAEIPELFENHNK